jgi:hypothetical protein
MKTNKTPKKINVKCSVFATLVVTSMMVATCHGVEKQNKIERLDSQIADLDKKIKHTKDTQTTPSSKRSYNIQNKYNHTIDSVQKSADSTEMYSAYNDSLIDDAFNKYAVRIGQDFQISQFLSQNDILIFQKYLANLDSTDFIHEQARRRILNNHGSLNDLSYFLEIIDYDSANNELSNKLCWNFDTYFDIDTDSVVLTPVLSFDTTYKNGININKALATEQKLLNLAWNKPDTNTVVPEIDSMYKNPVFAHNDSILRKRYNDAQKAIHLEDSLYEYKNTLTRARDSLIRERKKLEK